MGILCKRAEFLVKYDLKLLGSGLFNSYYATISGVIQIHVHLVKALCFMLKNTDLHSLLLVQRSVRNYAFTETIRQRYMPSNTVL